MKDCSVKRGCLTVNQKHEHLFYISCFIGKQVCKSGLNQAGIQPGIAFATKCPFVVNNKCVFP